MRTGIRIAVAFMFMLSSSGQAAAAVAAAVRAASTVKTGFVAPVPGGALGAPLTRALLQQGSVLRTSGQASVLPSLPSLVSQSAHVSAAMMPKVSEISPRALERAQRSGLPAPPSSVAGDAKVKSQRKGVLPAGPSVRSHPLYNTRTGTDRLLRSHSLYNTRTGTDRLLRSQLSRTEKAIAPALKTGALSVARTKLGELFDGMMGRGVNNVSRPEDFREPDWSEDRRINRALRTLAESDLGLDIYRYVSDNYDISIEVDDNPSADYDARISGRGNSRTLTLTESLVDNQSKEVVAAYIAREMSELYFDSFPESVERNYMAHGNMVRVFAELTRSGLRRPSEWWKGAYWWNRSRDQYTDGRYAMKSYYDSWKAAVEDYARNNASIEESSFFQYLKDSDTSNKGRNSRRSLYERYRRGDISYDKYQEMRQYLYSVVDSESEWFGETGRW